MLFVGRGARAVGSWATYRLTPAVAACLLLLLGGPACRLNSSISLDAAAADNAAASPTTRLQPASTTTARPTPSAPPATSGTTRPAAPATRIAFVHDGDLYLRDDELGVQTRLTASGNAAAPWWTLDGQSLFFEQASGDQRQLWRWQPGMATAEVRAGTWASDGMHVAFSEPTGAVDGPPVVWAEVNGRRAQLTPVEADATSHPLAWSPDGSHLALAWVHLISSPVPTHAGLYPAGGALWLVDRSGRQHLEVQLPTQWGGSIQSGQADAARFSPSGQTLIVWVGPPNPCASCRADGAAMLGVRIDNGSAQPLGTSLGPGSLAWLPTGEAIVVEPGGRETYENKHLVRVDPATGARVPLANDTRYVDLAPAVSPDGSQVAFVRGWAQVNGQPQGPIAPDLHVNVATIASRRIWLMAADGSQPHPLTAPQGWTDAAPAWTPDGQWLVFVRWRPPRPQQPAAAELWAVHPDGSGVRRLVTGLELPQGFNNGFGFYGTLGWRQLFAVAPR